MAAIPPSLLRLFPPIEHLLTDPTIRRVFVDGADRVHVERHGRVEPADVAFGPEALTAGLEELARRAGKVFDATHPSLEARLKDGTRFLALRPPAVADGPILAVVRPGGRTIDLPSAVREGILTAEAADLLASAMADGQNIVVVGPPGSGRTSLMEALASAIPPEARVGVLEEIPELRLPGRTPIRFVPRRGGADAGGVSVGDLLYCAGRLGLDRLLLGTVRWQEAWDAAAVLARRAVPVLLSFPGLTAVGALARFEALARAAAAGPRERAVPGLLGAGLDLAVTLGGRPGVRRVVAVDRVSPGESAPRLTRLLTVEPAGSRDRGEAKGVAGSPAARVSGPVAPAPPPSRPDDAAPASPVEAMAPPPGPGGPTADPAGPGPADDAAEALAPPGVAGESAGGEAKPDAEARAVGRRSPFAGPIQADEAPSGGDGRAVTRQERVDEGTDEEAAPADGDGRAVTRQERIAEVVEEGASASGSEDVPPAAPAGRDDGSDAPGPAPFEGGVTAASVSVPPAELLATQDAMEALAVPVPADDPGASAAEAAADDEPVGDRPEAEAPVTEASDRDDDEEVTVVTDVIDPSLDGRGPDAPPVHPSKTFSQILRSIGAESGDAFDSGNEAWSDSEDPPAARRTNELAAPRDGAADDSVTDDVDLEPLLRSALGHRRRDRNTVVHEEDDGDGSAS